MCQGLAFLTKGTAATERKIFRGAVLVLSRAVSARPRSARLRCALSIADLGADKQISFKFVVYLMPQTLR